MTHRRLLVGLCLAVVLAGCAAPLAANGGAGSGSSADVTAGSGDDGRLGFEGGYRYNDSVDVNASDGLGQSELEAVVSRAMARLELLRDREYTESLNVSVISREQYLDSQPFGSSGTHAEWNNQVWEGLFLVGEDRDISAVMNATYGSAVLGYYSPSSDRIVVVSDRAQPRIDRGTLVHELVHALQDQQFGLEAAPATQDGQLARNGVVEGEAALLESRYQERCGREWDCVETPSNGAGSGSIDAGVLTVIRYPYVVGPAFVEHVQSAGGWDAVDALYRDLPASTEQVSYPAKYPGDAPVNVTVPDRSNADWERFDHDPVADTLGQASLWVMFQQNGVVDGRPRYRSNVTDGWEGDSLVPYHSGDRSGYVWELAWETPEDAREFVTAYRDLLAKHDATRDGDVYTIPGSSTYGDAFRVTRDGTRVRIVNAPTRSALSAIGG